MAKLQCHHITFLLSLIKKLKVELLMLCWLKFISINRCICVVFFGYINVALLSYADKCFVVEFATLMQLLATFNTLKKKMHEFWMKKLKSKQRGSEFFVTAILLGSAIPNKSSVTVWNLHLILGIHGYLINIRIENAIKDKWGFNIFVPPRCW